RRRGSISAAPRLSPLGRGQYGRTGSRESRAVRAGAHADLSRELVVLPDWLSVHAPRGRRQVSTPRRARESAGPDRARAVGLLRRETRAGCDESRRGAVAARRRALRAAAEA